MEPPPAADRDRSFLGSVNIVMATYAAEGLLAFATGVLVARELGTSGRGAYGIFVVSAGVAQLLLGLGAGNAAIYYLNRGEVTLRQALAAAHTLVVFAVVASGIAAPIALAVGGDDVFGGVSPWMMIAAVPLFLYFGLLRLLLQALQRFVDLGVVSVGQQLIFLLGAIIITTDRNASVTDIILVMLGATVLASAYALIRLDIENVDAPDVRGQDFAVLRKLVRFGMQGEAGNLLQALNYRLDQFIVRAWAGLAGVGIYAVSVSVTEAVFILANAVALVLMPRLTAASADEAARLTPVASRNTMLVAAAGAIVLAALGPLLLPFVFGEAYDASVEALWLLLPGTVALAGAKVLTSYIFSQGRPALNTAITSVSLVVTIALDLALVPAFGVNGAAAAASVAYTVHLLAALVVYSRISGAAPLGAVIPRAEDLRLYIDAVRSITSRISRAPLADGR